jgi:hypothetical protein
MDLKFKNNKFYFSILPDLGGLTPILIPRISNPDFLDKKTFKIKSPPGIRELLEGDLGITEQIMVKVLDPVFESIAQNVLVADMIANQVTHLDDLNSDIVANAKSSMLSSYIPKDNGLKALEKTIISTMMESHKPIFDFAKILMEILGVAEDVVCRFLGTSIKVLGKEVGFPSRKPQFWDKKLGYAQTITYSSKDFETAFKLASNEFIKKISPTHPLKGAENQSKTLIDSGDSRAALYVGYFDESGNEVEPPAWVMNSNKWLKKEVLDSSGNKTTIGSPFKRLSTNLNEGVEQIREYHLNGIVKLQKQKQELVDVLNSNIKEARSKADIEHIESQKIEATKVFDSLSQCVYDLIDGTNISGDNHVDDGDISKGVNTPIILTEWITKVRAAQLRQKYFPNSVTTVQSIVDRKGKPVEPYTYIPTVDVEYKGTLVKVESPLAFENQVSKKKFKSTTFFYDKKEDVLGTYSNMNIIKNYDIFFGTTKNKPHLKNNKTWFSHNTKDVYMPDALKGYYLPIEWEEVLEYEVRNKTTGQLIRKEYETTVNRIDIENDYELRVIKVINRALPLAPNEKNDNVNTKGVKVDPVTGTIFSKGNNIPETLTQDNNGMSIDTNKHSTPDINEENNLKEGVIKQGLDPRYPNKKTFFLVEAIRKNSDGMTVLNGKVNQKDLDGKGESGGKEWYGLLDKYTAFPMIVAKLLPLVGEKLIPLIIEILQLIQNPTKIKDMLLDLVLDKKISKFPEMFPNFDKDKGVVGKVRKLKKEGFKVPTSFDEEYKKIKDKGYYAGVQLDKTNADIISMIDGQAIAEFGKGIFNKPLFTFGVNIKASDLEKPIEITKDKLAGVKEQPILTMILNFIKMPFEVVFKIFMWVIKWVKKLLNPLKIPAAIKELISFDWLKKIIGKDGLFKILGLAEPDLTMLDKLINAIKNKDILRSAMDATRNSGQSIEVLVYDLFKNGVKVGTQVEERPFTSVIDTDSDNAINSGNTINNNKLDVADLLSGLTGLLKGICGERNFSLNDILPIPLLGEMPKYNMCELPVLFLKPLEMIGGILHLVQELLNALIAMPLSIFGLEPHIKIPKFGKEIPMFDKFEEMLQALRDSLTPPIITE